MQRAVISAAKQSSPVRVSAANEIRDWPQRWLRISFHSIRALLDEEGDSFAASRRY
jgi:hypothetical protein